MVEKETETFLCEKHSANCAKTLVLRSILPRGLNSPVFGAEFAVLFDLKENNKMRNNRNRGICPSL